jgi:adenine-specific DNA-methyltransferase
MVMSIRRELPVRILEMAKCEGLVEYAERLSEQYSRNCDHKIRKTKGQFFTPKQVSVYMAGLFEVRDSRVRLLDPGAGTGILTAAFCERVLNNDTILDLTIDAYESDPHLLPLLEKVLELCKLTLEGRGHNVNYNIYGKDFILHNKEYFKKRVLSEASNNYGLYDFVISNPPYYKLNKNSPQSTVMMELISGQANIYALFMALSAGLLKPGGEMVFITPRSFCSGLYYKKFREWFLKHTQIVNIHIFESRKEIFDRDEVLQENIIIKAKKKRERRRTKKIIVSTSRNKNLNDLKKFNVRAKDILYYKNGDVFIRIPASQPDVKILHVIDSWPHTLHDLGFEISTGPVVPFRAKEYLLSELTNGLNFSPLLWMHNIRDMKVMWPVKKNKKPLAIHVCDRTEPLLLPLKNYVLVNRFSSKEQKRRLYAGVLLESEFSYSTVGIENHINYIHKPGENMSVYEAFGIATILNTTIVDNFFRSLNGSTQVNATDIRSLPFPKIEDVRKVGEIVYKARTYRGILDLDSIVARVLGIDIKMINPNKG